MTRWGYVISGKLTAQLDLGVQLMQSMTSGSDPTTRPVLDANINYFPRYGTSLTLGGYRSAEAAELRLGEVYTGTGVRLTARQRAFYEKTAVVGRLGYSVIEFDRLKTGATAAGANYDVISAGAEVQWRPNARLVAGLFYQFSDYSYEIGTSSFSNHQVGLNATLKF